MYLSIASMTLLMDKHWVAVYVENIQKYLIRGLGIFL